MRDALPEYLKPVLTMDFIQNETWRNPVSKMDNVHVFEKKITLDPGMTKNDEARLSFYRRTVRVILNQKRIRDLKYPACDLVFSRNGIEDQRFS